MEYNTLNWNELERKVDRLYDEMDLLAFSSLGRFLEIAKKEKEETDKTDVSKSTETTLTT